MSPVWFRRPHWLAFVPGPTGDPPRPRPRPLAAITREPFREGRLHQTERHPVANTNMNNDKNSHQITPSGTTAHPEQTVPDNNPASHSLTKSGARNSAHQKPVHRRTVPWNTVSPIRRPICNAPHISSEPSLVRRLRGRSLLNYLQYVAAVDDGILGFIVTEVDAPHDRLVEIPVFQHEEFDDEI